MAVIWKGFTVKQPYGDLLAIGAKHYEWRSKPTKYRGPVVIHAGKAVDEMNFIFTTTDWTSDSVFKKREAIQGAIDAFYGLTPHRAVYGAIIAYADIVGCYRYEDLNNLSERERLFGYAQPGMWAWEIKHVNMVEPLPYKGQLGLWNIPYDVVRSLKEKD